MLQSTEDDVQVEKPPHSVEKGKKKSLFLAQSCSFQSAPHYKGSSGPGPASATSYPATQEGDTGIHHRLMSTEQLGLLQQQGYAGGSSVSRCKPAAIRLP